LILDSIVVDESGRVRFVDFVRDDVAMRDIFERFVRNLMRHKLGHGYSVVRKRFPFKNMEGGAGSLNLVPTMITDAVVTTSTATLIVEVKFVPGATVVYRGVERLRSSHLYQLSSYLQNYPNGTKRKAGLLVYPAIDKSRFSAVTIDGVEQAVLELDLTMSWPEIEAKLISAVSGAFQRMAYSSAEAAA